MIPRNPAPCAPKKLGFSSSVSRHPSSLSSIRGSISGLSINSSSAKSGNRSFVLRAEAEPESEAVATIDVAVAEEEEAEAVESGSEPEAEAEAKPPRKPRVKLGDIMGILNKRAIEASDEQRPIPDLRTGDIVEIKLEVPENRRRLSIYKGIVISRQNAGIHTTIRIRRIIAGIGVEIVFPMLFVGSVACKPLTALMKEEILSKHQRDQAGEAQEGEKGKVILFERQTSQALHFQMRVFCRVPFSILRLLFLRWS
ncbi:hypothetical protein RJ639_038275 [Escallonia herrerae]|uniref:Ribosomal protein L19 n=1 Tax=Escallonia herrerae TaxID=1293975 RepID=A0AA88WL34_9ASTE|nr:hypothetical protein RJ639_038275 [Escallonia herrerae]